MAKNYTTVSHTMMLKYLSDNRNKLITVNELAEFLRNNNVEVNLSTIYRFLNKLSDSGDVMKYVAKKGEMSSFQYIARPDKEHDCRKHLHLQCVKCGGIVHLDCDFMKEIEGHIIAHHGFRLQCEASVLYGICSKCSGNE